MLKQEQCVDKTDEELVGLSLTNQAYFVCLIKRYEAKLLRYIKRLSNFSLEDAEDILQEVFIKVYQNLNAFDPQLKFSSWIYRITHNQVISAFRKTKARPLVANWDVNDDWLKNFAADFDIKKEIDDKLLRKTITLILDKLDFKYSQILVLKFLENKSYKEISDILQKPEGTIAAMLFRAKKQFAKEIARQNIKI
jgi:RNA polymerase sigma-70 factor, ECF subfamily